MAELIIVRGLPGSGKTTFARKLCKLMETPGEFTVHIEADMFFEVGGEYKFVASAIPLAHQWCQGMTKASLEGGSSVVVSNTFTRVWEMQPYLDMAKEMGIRVTVLTVEGANGNIHGVPEESINKMKQRWERYEG